MFIAPGGWAFDGPADARTRRWTSGSPTAVVGGFDSHLNIVRVALGQAGTGDPGELTALLQVGDRGRAGVTHGGAPATDELVRDAGPRAALGHLPLDPLGDELVVGED